MTLRLRHYRGRVRATQPRLIDLQMAALAERGIAPVVNVPSDYSDQRVYRLARNEQEVAEEIRKRRAYIRSLETSVAGLQAAWDGTGQAQGALFQEAV